MSETIVIQINNEININKKQKNNNFKDNKKKREKRKEIRIFKLRIDLVIF